MNCPRQTHIVDYLHNELDPEQSGALERHVAQCDACSRELRALQSVLSMCNNELSVTPSAGFCDRVLVGVEQATDSHEPQSAQDLRALEVVRGIGFIEPSAQFVDNVMAAVETADREQTVAQGRTLSCEDVRELMVDYSFEETGRTVSTAVTAHLGQCYLCREAYQEILDAIHIARSTGRMRPSHSLPAQVMSRISVMLERKRPSRGSPSVRARIYSFYSYHAERLPIYGASILVHAAVFFLTLTLAQNQTIVNRLRHAIPAMHSVSSSERFFNPGIETPGMPDALISDADLLRLWDTRPPAGQTVRMDEPQLQANRWRQDEVIELLAPDFIAVDRPVLQIDAPTDVNLGNAMGFATVRETIDLYSARMELRANRRVLGHLSSPVQADAIRDGLIWLCRVQLPDGSWPTDNQFGGLPSQKAGVSGLATLCFLGLGFTHDEPTAFQRTVQQGLVYLLGEQDAEGYIGRNADNAENHMYNHAIGTLALLEACALSHDNDWLREPLERAVKALLSAQLRDGSWGYHKTAPSGDASISIWQMTALHVALKSGLRIDGVKADKLEEALARGFAFLRTLRDKEARLHYNDATENTYGFRALTAADLFVRNFDKKHGEKNGALLNKAQLDFLRANAPEWNQGRVQGAPRDNKDTVNDIYYCYYGSMAMQAVHEMTKWNDVLDSIAQAQEREGDFAGSWNPEQDKFGVAGRIYVTSMALLSLEARFRYTTQR